MQDYSWLFYARKVTNSNKTTKHSAGFCEAYSDPIEATTGESKSKNTGKPLTQVSAQNVEVQYFVEHGIDRGGTRGGRP